jgi:hypothetical protein
VGTPTSTYREGNATVQFEVTPANATYNTVLNAPDPEPTWAAEVAVAKRALEKRRATKKMGRPKMSGRGKRVV